MSFLSSPSLSARRALMLLWIAIATLPVAYIATQVAAASRNIVFWDEFDTALDLILRMHAGADWQELLQRFFALNNEHRTVTSRLMFATSYWLTGTVNFHAIGAIGNLFLVGACTALVLAVRGWERRVRLGVVLAFMMFQLEHFENFIWSGASIDHFQVVMLAVVALTALARGSWPAWSIAVLFAVLATFTLAHGNVTWPAGAALLLHQRRWRQLAAWCALAVAAVVAFLHGFEFNPGHNITDTTLGSVGQLARYWLALLGAPLTLGEAQLAPLPGFVLVAGLGILIARGAAAREPVVVFTALFAIGALALIALGRAQIANNEINSRYMVLSALAWALFIFLLLEHAATPDRPFRMLACLVPALAAFNVSANVKFAPMVDSFVEVRDRAATSFQQFGQDGRGITRLHPRDEHADILLRMAEERGVYRLPRFSHEARFSNPTANDQIITHFDELLVNDRAVTLGGWAMIPGRAAARGEIYVVLRSDKSLLYFSTVTLQRPDVAKAYKEPRWRLAGFRAVIERERLPAEDFEVGALIADDDRAQFIMTPNRLLLASPNDAKAVRLTGNP